MKKSHRKDVIIARIIFAVICLVLVAVIVGAVFLVRNHLSSEPDEQTTQESQSTENPGTLLPSSEQGEPTEVTQEPEPNPILRTTTGVNLRSEPNTDCEVLAVLDAGTQLELLGEEDGWAIVSYQGQTGYVSMDYLEDVMPQ